MSDNIPITPGSGALTVGADECSVNSVSVKLQEVKVALGAKGVFTDFLKGGQLTMANSVSVVIASDQPSATIRTVGSVSAVNVVGRDNTIITVTPTVSTSPAYTAGDAVGGKQTLANAYRASGGTSVLQTLVITDNANQGAAFDILLFNADPSAATITDNAAFVFSTDFTKVIGRIAVATGDYVTVNSKKVALKTGLGIKLKGNATTSLYAAVVTSGTPTFAATSDLQFIYGLDQD